MFAMFLEMMGMLIDRHLHEDIEIDGLETYNCCGDEKDIRYRYPKNMDCKHEEEKGGMEYESLH